MLTISSANNGKNLAFGTNLVLGQGVIDQLNKHPEELKQIKEFKEYLAQDGKNFNAELSYDTFTPQNPQKMAEEAEASIRKYSEEYDCNAREQAKMLIEKMNPTTSTQLIEKLLTDSDRNVSRNAADFAGYINDPKAAAKVLTNLSTNKNPEIREEAASAISNIKDSNLQSLLIGIYIKDSDYSVKRTAANNVYDIKDKNIQKNLIIKLADSPDAAIRDGVSSSLHSLKDKNQPLFDNLLEKFSNDIDPKVRQKTYCQVADLDDEEIKRNPKLYDNIIEKSAEETAKYSRSASASIIGKHSNPDKAIELINERLKDEELYIREDAARSAKDINDPEKAAAFIEKLTKSNDNYIQQGAQSAAIKLKDKEKAGKFINEFSQSQNEEIKKNIAYEIDKIKDEKQQREILEKLAKDPSSKVREKLGFHLLDIQNEKLHDEIIKKYIQSPDLSIKMGLADRLEYTDADYNDKAKEYAQILAKDEDKFIQKKANDFLNKAKMYNQTDSYKLKITDGEKPLGEKKIIEPQYGNDSLFGLFKKSFDKLLGKD